MLIHRVLYHKSFLIIVDSINRLDHLGMTNDGHHKQENINSKQEKGQFFDKRKETKQVFSLFGLHRGNFFKNATSWEFQNTNYAMFEEFFNCKPTLAFTLTDAEIATPVLVVKYMLA